MNKASVCGSVEKPA